MTYLLDTNVCIGWLRQNQSNVVERIQQHQPSELVICSVVVGELRYGIERSNVAHRRNTELRVEQLRRQFVSLPFDDAAAEEYGRIRAHLANLGTPIGANDMQIAAICRTWGLTLVTHNTVEFCRVPNLLIEDWQ